MKTAHVVLLVIHLAGILALLVGLLVQVTRPASNGVPLFLAASDGLQLNPGGVFLFFDPVGVTVTAATGDILTVTNSAGTNVVTYDIVIVGTD